MLTTFQTVLLCLVCSIIAATIGVLIMALLVSSRDTEVHPLIAFEHLNRTIMSLNEQDKTPETMKEVAENLKLALTFLNLSNAYEVEYDPNDKSKNIPQIKCKVCDVDEL